MTTSLSREDIIKGLRDVIRELHRRGETVGIRIVGGAALSLRYFDRGVTTDVDAVGLRDGREAVIADAAQVVAGKNRWVPDWLNFEVRKIDALPVWGRSVEWEILYAKLGVTVEVPSPEVLLVMKLRASRRGRDTRDIRMLLGVCQIQNISPVESLYEDFYPGDALPDRALEMLEGIFAEGVPSVPEPVPLPIFSP